MFRVILLLSIWSAAGVLFAQESTIYLSDHPEYPKYLNGQIVADLIYPGRNFRRIEKLGAPIKTKNHTVAGRNAWTLVFSGFMLEYVDVYGEPELHRLVIHGPAVELRYQNELIMVGRPLKTTLENVTFTPVPAGTSEQKKYQGTFEILEVRTGSNGRISEIIYQRDLR